MIWPPDYTAEYNRRAGLIYLLEKEPHRRAAMMQHYKRNLIDFINDWGVTYDPRIAGFSKIIPFILFPRQIDFIFFIRHLLNAKQPGLVEKSRDMGATWLCCVISVWLWLFHPGASIGWGSRDQDTVDQKGNPDCIFEKIRMQLDALPTWMLPKGYEPRLHSKFMNIINPENKSSIKGDAGDNIGRGGRSLIYFKDESAHYEHPEQIEAALGDNTDVQVDISSVNGTANVFYRRRTAGEIWYPGAAIAAGKTRVFIFDWRDHPGKSQLWYNQRRTKYEAEGLLHLLAQEVDRDYASAVKGTIIPAPWVQAAIDAHKKLGFGFDGERICSLDVAGGDSTTGEPDEGTDKHAYAIRYGVVLRDVSAWAQGDEGQALQTAYTRCQIHGCTEINYDCIGVGAGVKVQANRMRDAGTLPKEFPVLPWSAAANPEGAEQRLIPGDVNTPLVGDFLLNRKAQGAWLLAGRFERTFKAVTRGEIYDPADLISLDSGMPELHALVQEISQPVWVKNGKGKLMVDKKPKGATSPNRFDATMMSYHPMRTFSDGLGYYEFLGQLAAKDRAEKMKNVVPIRQ